MDLKQTTELYKSIFRNFYREDSGVLLECAPPQPGDRDSCFLFSYFATTGAMARAAMAGYAVGPCYKRLVDGLAFYRAAGMPAGQSKYHSERGEAPNGGHGLCFFDDNIWVARNLLFAFDLLGEPCYLEEAWRVVNYTYTAWDDQLGGLVWNENGLGQNGTEQELERGLSANACCIIVNARLYQLTGKAAYLDWAHRFYAFCKQTQDPESKIYYNGIHTLLEDGHRVAGQVNRDLYAYNAGSMVLANLLLYDITGEAAYRQDAMEALAAAHHTFLKPAAAGLPAHYKDFVWFLAILAEAAQEAAKYDEAATRPIFDTFKASLDYAWGHFLADIGLLPHDYTGGWRAPDQEAEYDRLLLTHAATAEIAFILQARARSF